MTLHQAAQSGDVVEMRRLMAAGADVDERDVNRVTALHWAADEGHVEVLRVLMEDKDAKDANGWTALHWAAFKGHVEAMRLLMESGADMDAKDADGWTALHCAANNGHVEVIRVLAQLGAQLDAQTAAGETPLQLSIRLGHHQVAQVLRELERSARTQKAAATSERTQQAAERAERIGAQLIEEEEREQAAKAQSKVRGVVELAPVRGVSDAVSLAYGWVASSEVSDAAFLVRRLPAQCEVCSGLWCAAEGQAAAGQG
jgi:hypothetical protein